MGKLIGIFATEISSRVQGNFYRELHKAASKAGYTIVFFSANFDRTTVNDTDQGSKDLFKLADRMDFAAIIIHAQSINDKDIIDKLIEDGHRRKIPVFLYDSCDFDYAKDDGIIIVNLDYKQGFAEGVKHLIEVHNCKRIYMLAGVKDNKFSDDRIEVYKREMTSHGLSVDDSWVMYGDFWEKPAIEAINNMLDSELPLPEAICCANDSMAIAAAKTLMKRGIRVPEDIRIAGFDGIEDGKYNVPVISSSEPFLKDVSTEILDIIENDVHSGEIFIPFEFHPKDSCGCKNEYETADRQELATLLENSRQSSWQHSMLSNMQLELMDTSRISELSEYMRGILSVYYGFSHLYCIRADIECRNDYTVDFDRMMVHTNKNFLPDKEYDSFSVDEVFPNMDDILHNSEPDDFFVFRMLSNGSKKYGYCITKTNNYLSSEMKLFAQFAESFTNMYESVLRNMRLEQANQKLSEMYESMSEIYIRDVMTGLYNRNGYYKKLDEILDWQDTKDRYMHIIVVDMDGMKQINDKYGHQEGDNAIKAVASAIKECFSHPCIGARFGGDEFQVALFTENDDKPTSEQISERLNKYLETIDLLKEKEYKVGVSIGHVVCKVSDIKEMKNIEKIADDNMYVNKRNRKGLA